MPPKLPAGSSVSRSQLHDMLLSQLGNLSCALGSLGGHRSHEDLAGVRVVEGPALIDHLPSAGGGKTCEHLGDQ